MCDIQSVDTTLQKGDNGISAVNCKLVLGLVLPGLFQSPEETSLVPITIQQPL